MVSRDDVMLIIIEIGTLMFLGYVDGPVNPTLPAPESLTLCLPLATLGPLTEAMSLEWESKTVRWFRCVPRPYSNLIPYQY